eukprot:13256139-Alexandrium_andersonii.AAC.1
MSASSVAMPLSDAPARPHLSHQARVTERRSACPHRATAVARGTGVPADGASNPAAEGGPGFMSPAPRS